MAIDPHCQRPTVTVPKPTADRGDVHARLNAGCGKEVPKIVMGKLGKFEVSTRGRQAFLGAAGFKDSVGRFATASKPSFPSSANDKQPIFSLISVKRRSASFRSLVLSERRNCLPPRLTKA
jgi:hypothetical protein